MRFYESVQNGVLQSFGISDYGGNTITEERYNAISEALANMPTDTETVGYRLREDLTVEQYEIEQVTDNDIDDAEAFDIIFGGAE